MLVCSEIRALKVRPAGLAVAGQGVAFPCLASLTLGGNCIQDWASIDSLHMFPRLQALRLGGNPHPGDTPGRRYEVGLLYTTSQYGHTTCHELQQRECRQTA